MITIDLEEERDRKAFAKRAAKRFVEDKEMCTYTDDKIKPGCWFAIRWGLMDDCVVVFKVSDEHEVVNYASLVREFYEKSK